MFVHLPCPSLSYNPDPLGIEALAACLLKCTNPKCNVQLLPHSDNISAIVNKITSLKPDIVGLSLPIGSLAKESTYALLDQVSQLELDQECLFVLGNASATIDHEHLLRNYPFCLVALGEAEETITAIARAFVGDCVLNDVPNLCYINETNEVCCTAHRPPPMNINIKPHRPHLEQQLKDSVRIYIESSRGCSWNKCTFCGGGRNLYSCNKYSYPRREKSTAFLVEELIGLRSRGVEHVIFVDEDPFGGSTDRAQKITTAIGDANLNMTFGITIRTKDVYDRFLDDQRNLEKRKTLQHLRKVGWQQIFLGVESGVDAQLRRYGKGTTQEENRIAIEVLRNVGFHLMVGWIPIDPLVTIEELKDNLYFYSKNRLDQCDCSPFKKLRIYEGTSFKRIADSEGLLDGSFDSTTLTWSYRFLDVRIGWIANTCSVWETPLLPVYYRLMNTPPHIRYLKTIDECLESFYKAQFNVMKQLIQLVEDGKFKMTKPDEILPDWVEERIELLYSLRAFVTLLPTDLAEELVFWIEKGLGSLIK